MAACLTHNLNVAGSSPAATSSIPDVSVVDAQLRALLGPVANLFTLMNVLGFKVNFTNVAPFFSLFF